MQQLRTPVKKSGRSKIQNFLMNVKIQNFVMNYQSVKQQTVTGYDSRCGYDGVGKFRHPELRKGGQQSTKVGLMSPGSCHTFPSLCSRFQRWCVVQNPRIPMTSEFRWICFSNSLCTLCSFFLPLHVQISSRNREANRLHLDQEKTPEIQQRCWSQRHDPHGQWPQMCRGYILDQYTKKGWPSWYKQRQAQNNKAEYPNTNGQNMEKTNHLCSKKISGAHREDQRKSWSRKWKTNKTKKKSWDDRSRSKKEKWKESSVAIKKSGSRSAYKRNRWRTPGTSHVDRRSDRSYRSPSQVRHGSWRTVCHRARGEHSLSQVRHGGEWDERQGRTTKVPPKCKEVENNKSPSQVRHGGEWDERQGGRK